MLLKFFILFLFKLLLKANYHGGLSSTTVLTENIKKYDNSGDIII